MSETPVEAAPQAVIDHLTRQIAALSLDNAVLRAALDAATTPQPDEAPVP